jgi:ABC-type nitrate/sulfonate/bicarbonate transport system substrate-binding protein
MAIPLPIPSGVCVADAVKCKVTKWSNDASPGGTMKLATRRQVLAGLAIAAAAAAAKSAHAQEKLRVGVLRLASSGPVFIAQDRGYLRDQGLEVELKFFDAAQPIAVATASGDVEFGVTAFTGGLFNLAG